MQENDLILDRYRVLEHLGSGGFASVYRAFDERIARRVAIKILPLRTASGKGAPKTGAQKMSEAALMGLEEARTAAMLSHPAIVSLFDFEIDEQRGVAYLIMEDIDGATVADIPSEYLTDEVIAAILKAAADALTYAHKNGVLHLDIKPDNILISHEGQIKLADFGLAQLSHIGQNNGRGSKHGRAIAGTLGYMPLEQLSGDEVCEATDQWALAAVIYELFSDEYPYFEEVSRKPTASSMLKAQEADEVALLDLNNIVLEGIFTRALARNPDMRFESVKEFYEVLLAELGDRPSATAGKRELKKLIPELTNDEPDDPDEMGGLPSSRRLGRNKADRESRDFAGCLRSVLSITFKVIMGIALAICLLAWIVPDILLLSGNNRWLVVQVAAGVFIIGALLGLLFAANRARRHR
ncbi:MAG: serine/threonine protein kinase [Coriobacteriia bacterium]|nr:serine/threonine protein kinase [Coriobacteriia bacterium]